ncbi:hypothetical protein [Conexibacter arvalis]|uniref:Uncharacterized protein n=1 Tax=Conexibacter arvalis TaxID=912552 RepID=A0A840IFV2_9ACTN|nr:hypothetical protein [Conexibacter arvalis]MBB4663073.1 hypothetical protein [Conexibacter arvalis]
MKSRTLRFTGIHDYDYSTAFVDTVSGWETKTRKPKAIVLISQHTKAMLVASADDSRHWFRQRRRDHKRQIDDDYYMVRTERLRTFEALVGYLQRRETAP